jgi:hypothetical protein
MLQAGTPHLPLFLGFYDWGTWWQGEIAGEYFLSNSNLISHLGRIDVAPSDALGAGLLLFTFGLDEPASFAPGVTSKEVGWEADVCFDGKMNRNFTLSVILAYADPDLAIEREGFRVISLQRRPPADAGVPQRVGDARLDRRRRRNERTVGGSRAIPALAAVHSDAYGAMGLRDLCQAIHEAYCHDHVAVAQRDRYTTFPDMAYAYEGRRARPGRPSDPSEEP